MVNEVLPRQKLFERAWQVGEHIMTQPRTTRRLTTHHGSIGTPAVRRDRR